MRDKRMTVLTMESRKSRVNGELEGKVYLVATAGVGKNAKNGQRKD
jgi:hypothetical protein